MGIFIFQQYEQEANSDTEVIYAIRQELYSDTEVVYTLFPVSRDTEITYSIRTEVNSNIEVVYNILEGAVESDIEVVYGISVSVDTEIKYDIANQAIADTEVVYGLATTVTNDTDIEYDLSNLQAVYNDTKVVYIIIDFTSEQIPNTVSAVIGTDPIDLFQVDLSGDDDSYCADLSATIADVSSWTKCVPGEQIDITLNGVEFNMIIDSRKRTRGFNEIAYTIDGRSVTAKLGQGFASPVTKTWGAVSVESVVDELCTAAGITYEFNITDWVVLDNTLVSESEFPIQIIDKIAKAAGAIVQTKADGTLVIRYKYPVPPPNYYATGVTPDLSISDNDDIYNLTEEKIVKPKYNMVRVMSDPSSSETTYSITLTSYDHATRTATLKVVTHPVDNNINLKFFTSHVGGNVDIGYTGATSEQKIEKVEIVDGKGTVESPIISIDSTDYLNNTDLGTVSGVGTEITTNIPGQSIVEITYTTKYHEFTVKDIVDEQVQVYIEETS